MNKNPQVAKNNETTKEPFLICPVQVSLTDIAYDKSLTFNGSSYLIDDRRKKFMCYICMEKFLTKEELNKHKAKHPNKKASDDEDSDSSSGDEFSPPNELVSESSSGEEFSSNDELKSQQAKKVITINTDPRIIETKTNEFYRCGTCNVYFNTEEAKRHINSAQCIFYCTRCKQQCDTLYEYAVHFREHNSSFKHSRELVKKIIQIQRPAVQIDSTVSSSGNVETVIKKEHDADLFTCELCYDICSSKEELEKHMEFHKEIEDEQKQNEGVEEEEIDDGQKQNEGVEEDEEEYNECQQNADIAFVLASRNFRKIRPKPTNCKERKKEEKEKIDKILKDLNSPYYNAPTAYPEKKQTKTLVAGQSQKSCQEIEALGQNRLFPNSKINLLPSQNIQIQKSTSGQNLQVKISSNALSKPTPSTTVRQNSLLRSSNSHVRQCQNIQTQKSTSGQNLQLKDSSNVVSKPTSSTTVRQISLLRSSNSHVRQCQNIQTQKSTSGQYLQLKDSSNVVSKPTSSTTVRQNSLLRSSNSHDRQCQNIQTQKSTSGQYLQLKDSSNVVSKPTSSTTVRQNSLLRSSNSQVRPLQKIQIQKSTSSQNLQVQSSSNALSKPTPSTTVVNNVSEPNILPKASQYTYIIIPPNSASVNNVLTTEDITKLLSQNIKNTITGQSFQTIPMNALTSQNINNTTNPSFNPVVPHNVNNVLASQNSGTQNFQNISLGNVPFNNILTFQNVNSGLTGQHFQSIPVSQPLNNTVTSQNFETVAVNNVPFNNTIVTQNLNNVLTNRNIQYIQNNNVAINQLCNNNLTTQIQSQQL